ncbi:Plasmid stabilization system protein [Polystyrenella longa]|uniref:Plasmid stabilization system protein n=1 Tax=Polystyrenella longa TaxID=2528007 RepID=A0A518CK10_9PLAN|nr:type II toxin-antitoxin system RelE/ParE family toxin [Polystyrenella longa]QDU79562.1 Plasmid stabilization system protein [Polystyrenella longa]
MGYQVRLSARAEHDVEEVFAWFKSNKAIRAGRVWYGQLLAQIDTLEHHPDRCPVYEISDQKEPIIRELLVGGKAYKYRIFFTIKKMQVEILHIRHTARQEVQGDELKP